jgi:alpha-1,2-mannosyltransferase
MEGLDWHLPRRNCDRHNGRRNRPVSELRAAFLGRYDRIKLAAACLSALAAVRVMLMLAELPSRYGQVDFSVYYLSGYLLRNGENPYTSDLTRLGARLGMDTHEIPRATDPPTFLAIVEPLTLMPLKPAYWTWQLLNVLALAASLWMLLGRQSGLRAEAGIAMAALAVMHPAVVNHFFFAQNKVQILLLLVLTMRSLEMRRDGAAGLALALACLMRIFPLLIVGYLLIERRWRALIFTLAGLIGGLLVTCVVVGFPIVLSFVNAIDVLTATRWLHYDTNIALAAFVSRLYWSRFGENPAAQIEMLRHATIAAVSFAILGCTCFATLRHAPEKDRDSRLYSLWVATAIVLSPTAWIHYMVLLLIPFARIFTSASRNRVAIALGFASYALLMTVCPDGCITRFIPYTTTLSLMLAWGAALTFAIAGNETNTRQPSGERFALSR